MSEEYLGSAPLSQEDINLVYEQRAQSKNHKRRSEWRVSQSRQHTVLCPPTHATIKAGASAAVTREAAEVLEPSFDVNRNDMGKAYEHSTTIFDFCQSLVGQKEARHSYWQIAAKFEDAGLSVLCT